MPIETYRVRNRTNSVTPDGQYYVQLRYVPPTGTVQRQRVYFSWPKTSLSKGILPNYSFESWDNNEEFKEWYVQGASTLKPKDWAYAPTQAEAVLKNMQPITRVSGLSGNYAVKFPNKDAGLLYKRINSTDIKSGKYKLSFILSIDSGNLLKKATINFYRDVLGDSLPAFLLASKNYSTIGQYNVDFGQFDLKGGDSKLQYIPEITGYSFTIDNIVLEKNKLTYKQS